jgi:ATPase
MESDLSRPVIEVRSFPSNKMTHEIFSFGSECVVVPVDGSGSQSPAKKLASAELARQIQRWSGARVHHVEMASDTAATIFVDDGAIGAIVGQGGSSIRGMEEEFGLKLKVKGAAEIPRGTNKIGSNAPEWDMQAERSKGGHSWEQGGGGRRGKKGKRRR